MNSWRRRLRWALTRRAARRWECVQLAKVRPSDTAPLYCLGADGLHRVVALCQHDGLWDVELATGHHRVLNGRAFVYRRRP